MVGRYSYRKMRKLIFTLAIENGYVLSQEIAELTNKSLSSVSHLLRKLHKEGWLCRKRDKDVFNKRYIYYPSTLLLSEYDDYMALPDD